MKKGVCAAALVAMIIIPAGLVAAHEGASGATRARMEAMTDMGRTLKYLSTAMRKGDMLDDPEVALRIEILRQKADTLPSLFANREIPDVSEASPAIWDQPEQFGTEVTAFQDVVDALAAAHENGSKSDARSALRQVATACSGCHQVFRITQ